MPTELTLADINILLEIMDWNEYNYEKESAKYITGRMADDATRKQVQFTKDRNAELKEKLRTIRDEMRKNLPKPRGVPA